MVNLSLRDNRFLRFLLIGGVNTLFGYAIYCVALLCGVETWLALLAGTIAGTAFNFVTTGGYVFRQLSFSKFPKFVLCYFFVYGVNLCLIEVMTKIVDHRIAVQLCLAFPMALLAYILMSRFVFGGLSKVP